MKYRFNFLLRIRPFEGIVNACVLFITKGSVMENAVLSSKGCGLKCYMYSVLCHRALLMVLLYNQGQCYNKAAS